MKRAVVATMLLALPSLLTVGCAESGSASVGEATTAARDAAADDRQALEQALAALEEGDAESAVPQLQALADRGNTQAQLKLAVQYFKGEGVEKDWERGLELTRQAADAGDADSQNFLGMIYSGQGGPVPTDHVEAARWFRKAAEQNHAGAQENLGVLYASGTGVEADQVEALFWFLLSHQSGLEKAQINVERSQVTLNEEEEAEAERRVAEWNRDKGIEPTVDHDHPPPPVTPRAPS